MTTVTLSKPIKGPDGELAELELRELTLGEIEGIDIAQIGDTKVLIRLVSKSADIPPSAVKQISMRDLVPLATAIADFFGISPPAGNEDE